MTKLYNEVFEFSRHFNITSDLHQIKNLDLMRKETC